VIANRAGSQLISSDEGSLLFETEAEHRLRHRRPDSESPQKG
jgi:hypothetical protein